MKQLCKYTVDTDMCLYHIAMLIYFASHEILAISLVKVCHVQNPYISIGGE